MIQELAQTTVNKYISLKFIIVNQLLQAVTSVTYCVLTQNELETTASLKGN